MALTGKRILLTGGAGFIGTTLARRLVDENEIVVYDNLVRDALTGTDLALHPNLELRQGDVLDAELLRRAASGATHIVHLAAIAGVKSVLESPVRTMRVNLIGTYNALEGAVATADTLERFVDLSTSEVFGPQAFNVQEGQVTTQGSVGEARWTYAVSKLAGEHYCRVFTELYGLETVVLRPFNVYGPRQRPDSAYAAVIPLFIDALLDGRSPTVHGDGLQSRDFTYVDDAVAACLAAAWAPASRCSGRAYNVAGGASYSLLDLLELLGRILRVRPRPVHTDPRPGDVRHTRADIGAALRDLGHRPAVGFEEGLRRTVGWFAEAKAGAAEGPHRSTRSQPELG